MAVRELDMFLNCRLMDDTRSRLITKVTEMLTLPEFVTFRSSLSSDYSMTVSVGLYDILRRLPLFAPATFMVVGEVFSGLFAVSNAFRVAVGDLVANLEQYEQHVLWLMTDLYSTLYPRARSFKDLGVSVRQIKAVLASAYPFFPMLPDIPNLSPESLSRTPTPEELSRLRDYVEALPNSQARAKVFGNLLTEIGRRPEEVILNGNQLNLDLADLPPYAFWVLYYSAGKYHWPR
ncbi:hypothetical protein GMRT_10010 [Giardia muris]|uniref:Uncharacterized protein n=1 Tax=Giardia muris TaxID=5742 RepID=A0A4Z1T6G9_GIAMU|nr:hypothetical protein GMRT_10010 [Giardia muris]|eukprot:TNJ28071.1 hypothetical protein GMRT_10010 [Giardia muris]